MRNDPDSNQPQRSLQYWAFCADPDSYRIEDAVRELDRGVWTVPKGDVHEGDRAIIWKALGRTSGREAHRGIVAFAEVLKDPEVITDPNVAYWNVSDPRAHAAVRRVRVRYVVTPALPLWLDGPHHDLLADLSVSRGQGTVFHVTAQQWDALMAVCGGWPEEDPTVAEAKRALDQIAGKTQGGQGFVSDSARRKAIEEHAVALMRDRYEQAGWQVKDVSKQEPFDLLCRRGDEELRVEVKGTTSAGGQILLTRNEVGHARQHRDVMALCVVAGVQGRVDAQGALQTSGGTLLTLHPWVVDAGELTPLAFAYTLPRRRMR